MRFFCFPYNKSIVFLEIIFENVMIKKLIKKDFSIINKQDVSTKGHKK